MTPLLQCSRTVAVLLLLLQSYGTVASGNMLEGRGKCGDQLCAISVWAGKGEAAMAAFSRALAFPPGGCVFVRSAEFCATSVCVHHHYDDSPPDSPLPAAPRRPGPWPPVSPVPFRGRRSLASGPSKSVRDRPFFIRSAVRRRRTGGSPFK